MDEAKKINDVSRDADDAKDADDAALESTMSKDDRDATDAAAEAAVAEDPEATEVEAAEAEVQGSELGDPEVSVGGERKSGDADSGLTELGQDSDVADAEAVSTGTEKAAVNTVAVKIGAEKADGRFGASRKPWQAYERPIRVILWLSIILYPLISAFFGLDLGDTGYHLYHYQHLFDEPLHLSFTPFFSSVVGYCWDQLFGQYGLIAFNLLEVILEIGIVLIVYFTWGPMLGRTTTLLGSLLAVMAAGTYLNIFNYHQFNALLLVILFAFQYQAIMKHRYRYSFLAGLTFATLVFSRVGSVTAFVALFIYIFDYFMSKPTKAKDTYKHLLAWFVGAVLGFGAFILLLKSMGLFEVFVQNVFRLGDLARGDVGTSYNFVFLLRVLVGDNLRAMSSGLLFLGGGITLLLGFDFIFKPYFDHEAKPLDRRFGWRIFGLLLGILILGLGVFLMVYAYDINPAENWPQMTTGPRFVIGVMYIFGFLPFIAHLGRQSREDQAMRIFILSAYMIVVLTIAGSNTGTKHITLGLWLMAPLFVYAVKQIFVNEGLAGRIHRLTSSFKLPTTELALRLSAGLLVVLFGLKFGHLLYYTSNYDAIDRTRLVAQVDHPKLRYIYTTEEQKESMEGVLEVLDEQDEDQPLMIFGASLLYYYLEDRPSYCRPWVTASAFTPAEYEASLRDARAQYGNEGLPIILYCRTHYADGFGPDTLVYARDREKENNYYGKKELFYDFVKFYNYGVIWEDPYHVILLPWQDMPFGEVWSILQG